MIEGVQTGSGMSKIVKYGDDAYLCGQAGSGTTVTEQTQNCLARVRVVNFISSSMTSTTRS